MTLEDAAKDVIKAWEKWCKAEGWDNNEYDDFSAALNYLDHCLKKGAETANEAFQTPTAARLSNSQPGL